MFCITFVQIGVFDWLSGRQKGSIFVKKRLKIFFSETRIVLNLIGCRSNINS